MQVPHDRTTLEVILDWLDWKIIASLGLLLLAALSPLIRTALAALIRRIRPTPSTKE